MGSASVAASTASAHGGRFSVRLAVVGLLLAIAANGTGPWAAGADATEPLLARPSDDDLAADASIVVSDDLPVLPPGALDPTAAIEAMVGDVDALPVEASEIGALAATFGSDANAAFRFVRDEVRLEPYAGVLRGAKGTLAARAGNALDRAMLLHDLLVAMGHHARYAFGELDADGAAAVLERAFGDVPTGPSPAGLPNVGPIDLQAVADRAKRDYARIVAALGDRVTTIGAAIDPSVVFEQAVQDTIQQAWVQVERDGRWSDLDPTSATAEPGDTMTTATSTADEIPAEMRQAVTLRLVAETLTDGYVEEVVALERRLDSAVASSSQLLLLFVPGAGGGGLLGGAEATSTYAPVLLVDGEADVGAELPVAPADGGGFSDLGGFGGGGSGSELMSLRLEVTRDAPGHEPITSVRTLLDRVPSEVRASGAVTVDQLAPHVWSGSVPVALAQVHHVLVSDGGADPRAAAIDRLSADYFAATELADGTAPDDANVGLLLWPITALDETLALASERAVAGSLGGDGVIAFIDRPRVYVISLGPTIERPDGMSMTVDLMVDGISTLAAPEVDGREEAKLRMWYGVVQSALESEFARNAAVASLDPGRTVSSASFAGGAQLTVLEPDAGADAAPIPPGVRSALEEGLTVVVPGDLAAARTWWTVSTGDGSTHAVLDPALEGAQVWFGAGPNYLSSSPGGTVQVQRNYLREADHWAGVEYQVVKNAVAIGTIASATLVGAYIAAAVVGVAVGVVLVWYVTH